MKTSKGLVAVLERQDGYFEIGWVARTKAGQITAFTTVHGRTVALDGARRMTVLVEDKRAPYFTHNRGKLFQALGLRYGGATFKTREEAQDFLRPYAKAGGSTFCEKCGSPLTQGETCRREKCAEEVAA